MYQILLVDDEPIVKVALRTMLDWESLGFSICATASDGAEALQQTEKYHPDLIITDLKMPKMDGLELIRILKAKGYHGKIIVASNFGEYELVREALTLGAMDYILKISIRSEDLITLVKKAVSQLEVERQTQEKQDNQIKQLEHNLKKIKTSLLKDYLLDPTISEDYLLNNDSVDFPPLQESFLCLLTMNSSSHGTTGQNRTFTPKMIESILREILETIEELEIIPIDTDNLLIILPQKELKRKGSQLLDVVRKMSDSLKLYISSNPSITYSSLFSGYAMEKEQFRRCREAANLLFYGYKSIIFAGDVKFQHYINEQNYQDFSKQLTAKLEKGNLAGAMGDFATLLHYCSLHQVHPEIVKRFFQKVLDYIPICKPSLKLKSTDEYDAAREKISGCTECSQLQEYFQKCLSLLLNDNGQELPGMKKEVLSAIEFINQNYVKKITLADIARQVSLNENYLCRIFKEQTHKSIVNYLNEVRMENAAKILINGNVYMKEVAAAVGIDDPFYFTRLFKKYYGVNPTEYKTAQGKQGSQSAQILS